MNRALLLNRRTGQAVATTVDVAVTRRDRRQGLLGRSRLDPGAALVLRPCCAVHTAFMRFAIDVVFVGRDGGVLRIVHALTPWRIAWAPHAHAVVELAAGSLRPLDVRIDDVLYLAPVVDGA